MSRFKVVIPARYEASRLPGKPLLAIEGRPMIAHVCERALESGGEVLVATDDARIQRAVDTLGVRAVLTSKDHSSGTERLAEVVALQGWSDDTLIVNLQGDEPLMPASLIRQLAESLANDPTPAVATLVTPLREAAELFDPHVVKAVQNHAGEALYFSRAPIPWPRDHFARDRETLPGDAGCLRHIGIYAYRAGFIRRYVSWPRSPLETLESLEQLRILWHGERIRLVTVDQAPPAGVDTVDDLQRVRQILEAERESGNHPAERPH